MAPRARPACEPLGFAAGEWGRRPERFKIGAGQNCLAELRVDWIRELTQHQRIQSPLASLGKSSDRVLAPAGAECEHYDRSAVSLKLATRALAGRATPGATISEINDAVDALNRGFDECRVPLDCNQRGSELEQTAACVLGVQGARCSLGGRDVRRAVFSG